MSVDVRRGAIVALGILAVALGGALFPAAGVGSVPGGSLVESGPGSGTGPAETPVAVETPGQTTSPTATPTTTTQRDTPVTDSSATPSSTQTSTPTATATPTETPSPVTGDVVWYRPYVEGLLWIAFIVVSAGSLTVLLSVVIGSNDSPDGDPPVFVATIDTVVERSFGFAPSRIVARVPQVTMVVLVDVSTSTAHALGAAGSLLGSTATGLGFVVRGSRSATAGLFSGLGNALANPFSVSGSLVSVPGLLGGIAASGVGRDAPAAPISDARRTDDVDPPESSDDRREPTTIEDAWAMFAERLPVPDAEVLTPGESARAASEAGYPPGQVRRLRRLFEQVRYGGATRTQERIDAAIAAARSIREHREGEE